MSMITPTAIINHIVAQHPTLAHAVELLHIDYCCGGARSLEAVYRERRLTVAELAEHITTTARSNTAGNGINWTRVPPSILCDRIERTHHDYLRRELQRPSEIIATVVKVHGQQYSEFVRVETTFQEMRMKFEPHMMEEE